MLSRFVLAFLPKSKHLLTSWLQLLSAVIWEAKKIKSFIVSIIFPSICHGVMGPDVMILVFWILGFKPPVSLSSFTFIKGLFSSFFLSIIRGDVICISEVIHISPPNLIPACASFNLAFHMINSEYKLNNQGDNKQPWRTPFPILNQSFVPRLVLSFTSWPAYRFLRRQVRWSVFPISL